MKLGVKILLGFLAIIVLVMGLELGFGYFGVLKTKTVGVAQQNAERDVFEGTNSFTKAKRQEAIKAYREYLATDDELERNAIKVTIGMSLSDFDEDKYITNVDLKEWIKQMKY